MINSYSFKGFVFTILISIILDSQASGQISFPSHSSFRYLKGSQAASLPSYWMNPEYNDASWATGNAPFWYGDGTGGTQINDMLNSYLTFFMRTDFQATDAANIREVNFQVDYDDGFAIWINGELILSRNAPTTYTYNAPATALHESGAFELFTVSAADMNLTEGTNTLAVMGFNENLASTDFHIDLSFEGFTETPVLTDTVGLSFSHASGYYTDPFTLTIHSPDATANITYTIDGSNPQESATAVTGGTTVNININPAITAGRGSTPGFVVRASLAKPGYVPSYPTGRTFIFWNRLMTQTYPGHDWPSGNVLGITTPSGYGAQIIDYGMDPDVVNDLRYSDEMEASFLDIPTLSVITANENLFDANTGIYVNAAGHGAEWEKECTFEMFDPRGGEPGFNVNAGIRIRGGWSRHPEYAKHAFRMFFRSEYGDAKLNYPLFGTEGVDAFDKVDVRCEQNYAWHLGNPNNTMVREVFSRDMQRDMGMPYTRSRYYHLFLNGMYWGIYQTQERSEARFAADYFGDKAEDYDVVKVSTENWSYSIEATDGTTEVWQRIYNKLQAGFADNEDYYWLEGKDANGHPLPGGEVLVDIDNLIDYMLGIFYTGNFDAPTSSFGSNDGPNNFYAIKNRDNRDKGFIFLNHDAEHSLFYYAQPPGIGINENRVDLGTRSGSYQMSIGGFYGFHPQWLHFKLTANDEYRVRFADRAVMYLSHGAELSPEKCAQRFNARAEEIETAVIAESARWGDQNSGTPLTKINNWDPQIAQMNSLFFPARTNITINQLKAAGLYPAVDAPLIYRNGAELTEREYTINPGWIISLENPDSEGTLYYTIDGTDPRKIGGEIKSTALEGTSQNIMTLSASTIITARIYDDGNWSGLKQIKFYSGQDDLSKLKITEIHYHPLDSINGNDTISGKDFEFIEFKNTGTTALNLSGITLDSAVYYTFPSGAILAPGKFYVVVSKPTRFFEKYGLIGTGNFQGNLANSGEKILVTDSEGNTLMQFNYDDQAPWPEMADGDGFSLVTAEMNPVGDPGLPEYWRSSYHVGGSPFADDLLNPVDELNHITDTSYPEILIYPNPTRGTVHITMSSWDPGEDVGISLHQLDGRMIFSQRIRFDTSLNLNDFGIGAGIYILRIDSENQTGTRKIVYNP
jgi:hypothetical protein